MKFVITYSSGKTQEHTTEHESVEAFINQNFGSAWGPAHEAGINVEMVERFPAEQAEQERKAAEQKDLFEAEELRAAEIQKSQATIRALARQPEPPVMPEPEPVKTKTKK